MILLALPLELARQLKRQAGRPSLQAWESTTMNCCRCKLPIR